MLISIFISQWKCNCQKHKKSLENGNLFTISLAGLSFVCFLCQRISLIAVHQPIKFPSGSCYKDHIIICRRSKFDDERHLRSHYANPSGNRKAYAKTMYSNWDAVLVQRRTRSHTAGHEVFNLCDSALSSRQMKTMSKIAFRSIIGQSDAAADRACSRQSRKGSCKQVRILGINFSPSSLIG